MDRIEYALFCTSTVVAIAAAFVAVWRGLED